MKYLLAALGVIAVLWGAGHYGGDRFAPVPAAWADDDDDGGYDDDDDDDGGSRPRGRSDDRASTPFRNIFRAPAAPRRAPVPAPLPDFAQGEIVASGLSEADLAVLLARGFEVIEARPLPGTGATARRLRVPAGLTLEAAREEVRGLDTGRDGDFNHFYRTEQAEEASCTGPHCASLSLVGWPAPTSREASCSPGVPIGIIDTGINAEHTTFAGGQLEVHRLSEAGLDPSRALHGTAVTAILIGDPSSRSPGLVPAAPVIAVDAFHRAGSDERADVFTLVEALAFLADRGARVINLSLAGPQNTVLEAAVADLVARGVVLVAAAGNAGPRAAPAYPAAYEGVIAVTAVDARGNVYRRAGQGGHIDLAAPGVEVWTAASVSGARPKTGTSFAAPFVSAAAALILEAEPGLTPGEVAARLRDTARDLGDPGPDPVFGAGLVQFEGLCTAPL